MHEHTEVSRKKLLFTSPCIQFSVGNLQRSRRRGHLGNDTAVFRFRLCVSAEVSSPFRPYRESKRFSFPADPTPTPNSLGRTTNVKSTAVKARATCCDVDITIVPRTQHRTNGTRQETVARRKVYLKKEWNRRIAGTKTKTKNKYGKRRRAVGLIGCSTEWHVTRLRRSQQLSGFSSAARDKTLPGKTPSKLKRWMTNFRTIEERLLF